MNAGKILIAILTVSLSGAAFGQSRLPGPTRPDGGPNPHGSIPTKWDGTIRNPNSELTVNQKLADKLKTLLPEGTNPHAASRGFGELKEFVATVRAANNLNVPFAQLKSRMANGSPKELQKAIHELKPDADPKAESKKATEQAKQDIKESKKG